MPFLAKTSVPRYIGRNVLRHILTSILMCYTSILMITSAQIRAARALVGIDQRTLAEQSGVSLPTIQRMEAAGNGYVRGVVESLTKVVEALERAGIELIKENQVSAGGGRGVRLRDTGSTQPRKPPARPQRRNDAGRNRDSSSFSA
jgi:hypothetical protein